MQVIDKMACLGFPKGMEFLKVGFRFGKEFKDKVQMTPGSSSSSTPQGSNRNATTVIHRQATGLNKEERTAGKMEKGRRTPPMTLHLTLSQAQVNPSLPQL